MRKFCALLKSLRYFNLLFSIWYWHDCVFQFCPDNFTYLMNYTRYIVDLTILEEYCSSVIEHPLPRYLQRINYPSYVRTMYSFLILTLGGNLGLYCYREKGDNWEINFSEHKRKDNLGLERVKIVTFILVNYFLTFLKTGVPRKVMSVLEMTQKHKVICKLKMKQSNCKQIRNAPTIPNKA